MKNLFIYLSIIAIFLTASSFTSYSGRKVHAKNKQAYDFKFNNLRGEPIALSDYNGKLVIVNFWASWAAPCLREMPNLEKLHRKYQNQGVQVLGVAVVSKSEDVQEKARQLGITYPVVIGDKKVIAKYGSFSDLPSTFVIDEKGNILRQLSGSNDFKTLESEILAYLPDPSLTNR